MRAELRGRREMRVIVVGAGIGGLAAAAALVRDGHQVLVLERRLDPASGAGISLWPNGLAALDAIGLGDRVRGASAPVGAATLRWCDGALLRNLPAQTLSEALGESPVVIRRGVLHAILTGALPPDTVRYGAAAIGSRMRGDGSMTVTDSSGDRLQADLVVAADGTRSRLARTFNAGLDHRYTGYTAWRGIAERPLDPVWAGEVFGRRTQFGLAPLPDGRTYWFATERVAEGTAHPDELARVRLLADGWPEPIGAVLAATDPDSVTRTDLFDRRMARRWYDTRTVLIGDAAHPMRPHLGQGGCQALEDAATLAAALRATDGVDEALARYQRVRRRRVRGVVGRSRLIGQAINSIAPAVSEHLIRASRLIPDRVVMAHLTHIAGRDAGRLQLNRP